MKETLSIVLLGSTGSIGTSACNCIRRHPQRFKPVALATYGSIESLAAQVREFGVENVYIGNDSLLDRARSSLPHATTIFHGTHGLCELIESVDFDILLNALVGSVGLLPTVTALQKNRTVALANKESLVVGGEYISTLLNNGNGTLIPVDSEHSAILQCLNGEDHESIESIILTASGGPFREFPIDSFAEITPEQALDHPTWNMGKKITIDAATLMNKGFEVIEAHHLFSVPYEQLRIWIHPQSIIHSIVEFHDGAQVAQMGVPDMELPIQYALSYPHRLALHTQRLDLAAIQRLSFFEPDFDRFPCLRLCLQAGKAGGTAPVVLNAANEVAVHYFLNHKISFMQIAELIDRQLQNHSVQKTDDIETIISTDTRTRQSVVHQIEKEN
jgi:1-deoxy-D-xylulose-5-phosphate reductoisomerase